MWSGLGLAASLRIPLGEAVEGTCFGTACTPTTGTRGKACLISLRHEKLPRLAKREQANNNKARYPAKALALAVEGVQRFRGVQLTPGECG